MLLTLSDMATRYPHGLPLLDPLEDIGIDDPAVVAAVAETERLEAALAANPGARLHVGSGVALALHAPANVYS